MQSYPNCRRPDSIHNPDLVQYAQLMEMWGFDFRVILLDRSPESIIKSVKKRGFEGNFERLCETMLFSLRALQYQMQNLDPKFIAGGLSIERSYAENYNSMLQNWVPSLGFSKEMVKNILMNFKHTTPWITRCSEENQALYEHTLVQLYSEYAGFRETFNMHFKKTFKKQQ